jgi:hypothetical protein
MKKVYRLTVFFFAQVSALILPIWAQETGPEELIVCGRNSVEITSLAFSPNAKLLASISDREKTARL